MNLFPSTSQALLEIMEKSDSSDKSDPENETLLEVEAQTHLEAASKKQSNSDNPKNSVNPPKNKKARKKKSDAVGALACPVLFGNDGLLLVARAFMKVLTNAKQSTDKKAEKFWEEVCVIFEEFVVSANI